MNEEDIDYENLDDLPLLDHIEWNHCITEEVIINDLSQYDGLFCANEKSCMKNSS